MTDLDQLLTDLKDLAEIEDDLHHVDDTHHLLKTPNIEPSTVSTQIIEIPDENKNPNEIDPFSQFVLQTRESKQVLTHPVQSIEALSSNEISIVSERSLEKPKITEIKITKKNNKKFMKKNDEKIIVEKPRIKSARPTLIAQNIVKQKREVQSREVKTPRSYTEIHTKGNRNIKKPARSMISASATKYSKITSPSRKPPLPVFKNMKKRKRHRSITFSDNNFTEPITNYNKKNQKIQKKKRKRSSSINLGLNINNTTEKTQFNRIKEGNILRRRQHHKYDFRKPGALFGTAPRLLGVDDTIKISKNIPPPGYYDHKNMYNNIKPTSPSISIPKSKRFMFNKPSSGSLGPGQYYNNSTKQSINKHINRLKNKKITKGGVIGTDLRFKRPKFNTPGPGSYNNLHTINHERLFVCLQHK